MIESHPQHRTDQPPTPAQALAELRAGNERFVTGRPLHPNQNAESRTALADVQVPFAVVFGCSDSRLAAEIIFDQGLGDLFVVRTAGHTIGPEVLGSIEYAVTMLHAPLVVVLGHNSCGAVQAAREAVNDGIQADGHVRAVVDAVVPSVRLAMTRHIDDVDRMVDLHIERTVDHLLCYSDALALAVAAGRCAVVGMSYHLTDGQIRMVTEAGNSGPRPRDGRRTPRP